VEPENLHDNVEPMNMEDMDGNDGENEEEKGTKGENNMQIDKPDHKLSSGDSNSKSKTSPANQEIKGGKRALFHIPLIKMGASTIQGVFAKKKGTIQGAATEVEEDLEYSDVEHLHMVEKFTDGMDMHLNESANLIAQVQADAMAAIPEASTPSRRSKRRADSAAQARLQRAEKIKAARSLDASPKQGNIETTDNTFLHFISEQVNHNLNNISISLGVDSVAVCNSVESIKN
jgi:hypothetical protein